MSGIDEVRTIPFCDVCDDDLGFSMYKIDSVSTNDIYGRLEYVSGATVFRISRIWYRSQTPKEIIEEINRTKGGSVYSFRCRACGYLYTRRRRKLFFNRVLYALETAIRRGQYVENNR